MAPSSKAERLAQALNDLLATSPNAEAAAVVSFDGLTMASALPPEIDEERLGAMSAALLGLGEQAALGLGRGELNQLFVEGDHGSVFLMSAEDQAVLAVVTDSEAKIGFALFEMRRAARAIGEILGSDEDEQIDWDVADGALVDPTDPVPAPVAADEPSAEREQAEAVEEPVDAVVAPVAYVPPVTQPYEPGPIPAELASNPYFLAPRAWAGGDAQDESK